MTWLPVGRVVHWSSWDLCIWCESLGQKPPYYRGVQMPILELDTSEDLIYGLEDSLCGK